MSASNFFAVALDANIADFTITNIPSSGSLGIIVIEFTADGTPRTIAWDDFETVTVDWAGGTAPTLSSTNLDRDTFIFFTYDAGTTWSGAVFGQAL